MLRKEVKDECPTQRVVDLPEECSMSDGLCICGQFIVFFVRHVYVTRLKRSQDALDQLKRIIRGSVLDQCLRRDMVV